MQQPDIVAIRNHTSIDGTTKSTTSGRVQELAYSVRNRFCPPIAWRLPCLVLFCAALQAEAWLVGSSHAAQLWPTCCLWSKSASVFANLGNVIPCLRLRGAGGPKSRMDGWH
eukprot:4250124-Amphidinium_carterae.2